MTARLPIHWLGIAGIVGGLSWLLLHTLLSAEWGAPGTNTYQQYETFNRLWSLPLFLMMLGFIGVYSYQRKVPTPFNMIAILLLVTGFAAMLCGNIAEFWIFTDQPYGEMNARTYSWFIFLVGLLLMLAGVAMLGLAVIRGKTFPTWSGILLVLSLPVEMLLFLAGSFLFPTAIGSIVMGWLVFSKKETAVIDAEPFGQQSST
jgi:hypothetical protein